METSPAKGLARTPVKQRGVPAVGTVRVLLLRSGCWDALFPSCLAKATFEPNRAGKPAQRESPAPTRLIAERKRWITRRKRNMDGLTLDGRVALVTGGAGGIGAQVRADLASLGATVAVCDINEERAKTVAGDIDRAVSFGVDLSDPESIDAMAGSVRAREGAGHAEPAD
jgi:short chain dehydrogenase